MNDNLRIIVASIVLVLIIALFIFSYNNSFTGFLILDENSSVSDNSTFEIVTRAMAVESINECYDILEEMQKNNFSIAFINDTLVSAEIALKQADYAEVLRNSSSSEAEKSTARMALKLVDWKSIDYSDVIEYTNKIESRKKQAYEIFDMITAVEMKINDFSSRGILVSDNINDLKRAKEAFYLDQYTDSIKLIEQINGELEAKRAQAAKIYGLRQGAMNFFQKYWLGIIVFLIILSIIVYLAQKKIRIIKIQNKIKKLNLEKQILVDLMKKAQIERFKENKISGLVYNIRIKKYQEKLQDIKETLPVLENKLKKKR